MGNIYENDSQALGMAKLSGRCVLVFAGVPVIETGCEDYILLMPSEELKGRLLGFARTVGIYSDGVYAVLTDDGRPFYIGLSVNGAILTALSGRWHTDKAGLTAIADDLEKAVNALLPSFEALNTSAAEGIKRLRDDPRSRISERLSAIPFLLRSAYFEGERDRRTMAEEDLSRLYRSGIHDHIGGGFFTENTDTEWLVPEYEKRLSDNALAALIYTEAWRDGHMAFYRETVEETLDYCLRSLTDDNGLFFAGQRAVNESAAENPFLFTPADLKRVLGEDEGRHFGECYDVIEEANTEGRSIPNLIINRRWSLIPAGYDDCRERLRLYRESRGGVFTDRRTPLGWNGLMLAALSDAADAFDDRRYLGEAEALGEILRARLGEVCSACDLAFLALGFVKLYRADRSLGYLNTAGALTDTMLSSCRDGMGSFTFAGARGERTGANASRAAGVFCEVLDSLYLITGKAAYKEERDALLRDMFSRPASYGALSMLGWCALPCALHGGKTLLDLCFGGISDYARALASRYCPDVGILCAEPSDLLRLGSVLPPEMGSETGLFILRDGKWERLI